MTNPIVTVATSSFFTAVVVFGLTKYLEYRQRLITGRLDVLRLIKQLEAYASDCVEHILDEQASSFSFRLAQGDASMADYPVVPLFDSESSSIAWNTIGLSEAKSIFDLEVVARNCRSASSFKRTGYLPDTLAKTNLYIAQCGLEAIKIADTLRVRWKVGSFLSGTPASSSAILELAVDEAKAERDAIWRRTTGEA